MNTSTVQKWDLRVLQSPAGHDLLRTSEDSLACAGTGRTYPIVEGNAHLYDECDVPLSLAQEAAVFDDYVATSLVPDLSFAPERIYAEAKEVNTRFLFDSLTYEQPMERRVVELGAWRCESIAKFADLGFDSYAVDFFPGMVNAAARRHLGQPFHRVSAPMSVLPFKDGSIDLVFMHATLHHALPRLADDFRWSDASNLHDSLCEIRRVLTPDGALMLLGEGVYPEGIQPADRYHEQKARAGETFYESWYTMSEYESAFHKAHIFPSLMSNQTGMELELHGYENGRRVDLVKRGDLVFLNAYERLFEMSRWNAGHDWPRRLLPAWIGLLDAKTP